MATTLEDIMLAAYGKSALNRPGSIASEGTELVQLLLRLQRKYFAVAARINPLFYATSVKVTIGSGVWARPATAETIFRIERNSETTGGTGAAGDEVAVVPFDDKKAEPGMGAVYELGQQFYSAGNAKDPTGGKLTIFFSRRPTDPTAKTDPLDTQWPDQFNDVLIFEVAAYLAEKDGRESEAANLRKELDGWATLYLAFLEHATSNERRRTALTRKFATNTLVKAGP